MTTIGIMLGIANIVAGLLLIGLSIPLIRRRVKMNHWYGVRIAKSFDSEENWYRINEYGGRLLLRWSIPVVLIGVITLFIPIRLEDGALVTILGVGPMLLLIVPLIQTLVWASKL